MALTAIGFGLAIGVAIGLLGGGGSVLAVPVFVYVLGQPVQEATTASLVVVTAGALAGGLGHARGGRICWRHTTAFIVAALPGVVAGTALGNTVSGDVLIVLFAILTLLAAVATWRRAGRARQADGPPVEPSCPPLRVARDLLAGALIGAMTGFFGVGGGFLIVPTLAIFLALSMRLAVGTSLAIITVTSLMGLAAHLTAGQPLDLPITVTMTAACVAGALTGAALAGRVAPRHLGHAFALLVSGVSAYLLLSVAVLGGPPGS